MENKEFTVSRADMREALDAFGIEKDAIILTHSSLKACGVIEGGAEGVIDAIVNTVPDGTVVFPALVHTNWDTVYEDWHMDRPSEVGYITEVFRKQPNTLRSNQATHSVTARGALAEALTNGDHSIGTRIGIFGDTPFSRESAWEKMYLSREKYGVKAYTLMWGINLNTFTFKHLIEYISVEEMLAKIRDPELKADIMSDKCIYPVPAGATFFWRHWPMFHSARAFDKVYLPEGIGKIVPLGNAHLRLVDSYLAVMRGIELLHEDPYKWAVPYTRPWLDRLMRAVNA